MPHRSLIRIGTFAVVAALAGFSGTGFAQSNALRALDNTQAETSAAGRAASHPMAEELAASIDAYNRNARADKVTGDRDADAAAAILQNNGEARQLAHELDEYNARAGNSLVPDTRVTDNADGHAPYETADALATRLTRYNETGGSLAHRGQ